VPSAIVGIRHAGETVIVGNSETGASVATPAGIHHLALVLTGYGSIATSVEAMRHNAVNYLCKPVTVSQRIAGFEFLNKAPEIRSEPPSVEEKEREHIQRALDEHRLFSRYVAAT